MGTGASGGSAQGNALALSADGNSLLVGGPLDTPANGTGFGAVWFFMRSGGVWSQQGSKVQAAELSLIPEEFGWGVALSGDGDTAVIGGLRATNSPDGAIWILKRISGVWTQQGPPFIGTGGAAVAISADGNTLIDGSPTDRALGLTRGVGGAWAFGRRILAVTAPASAVAGVPVSINVLAEEPNNVVSADFDGNLRLTSTDPNAVLPMNAVLTQGAGRSWRLSRRRASRRLAQTMIPRRW